jgi:hypothetical protein
MSTTNAKTTNTTDSKTTAMKTANSETTAMKTASPKTNAMKTARTKTTAMKIVSTKTANSKTTAPSAAEQKPFDPKTLVLNPEGPEGPPPGDGGEGPVFEFDIDVSRQTLEQTPGRALAFLRGVGTSAAIRATMLDYGYTKEEHEMGWQLMKEVSGDFEGEAPPPDAEDDEVREAIDAVDAWDEDGLRIVNASLRNRHPEQHAYVMRGLRANTGVESVVGVSTMLDRLDALESAPEREGTREADHAALDTLAKRGIDKAERARLQALVNKAKSFAGTEGPTARQEFERRVRASMVKQRLWFEEWSEVARSAVKRRDQLIRLGLASRRTRRATPEVPPTDPASEPTDEPIAEPSDDEGAE